MAFENFMVVYPLDTQGGVLMARKKRKWCKGKLVGFGGKIKPHETVRAATERELNEELNLQAYSTECRLIAVLDIYTGEIPRRVFVLTGKPAEEQQEFLLTLRLNTKEFFAETLRFWDITTVEEHDLPEGDSLWLPEALKITGAPLHVQVGLNNAGNMHMIKDISSISWDIDAVLPDMSKKLTGR
jgi:8-oxo-dGTP pyrophosphatase MutT (NUDIX family)